MGRENAQQSAASSSAVDLALSWLVETDIRHADGSEASLGGVNQGYNWRERSYPFVYSEITGYAVSTFVDAYRWTGDERYIALARQLGLLPMFSPFFPI